MGYETGKIYKLSCSDGKYYFGSTIRPLKSRLASHKHASTKTETNTAYTHIKSIGWDNVDIELIELFPCENKHQLLERETWHIIQHKHDVLCLNTRNPLTDKNSDESKHIHADKCKTYYQDHREEILQKRKEYNLVHREQRAEYSREYAVKNSEVLKPYYQQYAVENRERRNRMARERRERLKPKLVLQ